MRFYSGSPVFDFPIDWSNPVNRSYDYNLRETKIGFGDREFLPTQTSIRKKFEITVTLFEKCDIQALESFIQTIQGSLKGFWLPGEREEMTLKTEISNSQFDIEFNNFTSLWNTRPDIDLWFWNGEGTVAEGARISGVSLQDPETEQVTLSSGLSFIPEINSDQNKTTLINRFFFVRLDSDSVVFTRITDDLCVCSFTFSELPEEYTTPESGNFPIYLYHIAAGATSWRWTSYKDDVIAGGNTYLSAPKIDHNSSKKEILLGRNAIKLSGILAPGTPWELFETFATSIEVTVSITETTVSQKLETPVIFSGYITNVTFDGMVASAECELKSLYGGGRVPTHMIQRSCNYNLFSSQCTLLVGNWSRTGVITIISGNVITATDPTAFIGLDGNFFTNGYIIIGSGSTLEKRSIVQDNKISESIHEFTLHQPTIHAIVTDSIFCAAGCDKRSEACENKFGNFDNFGGYNTALRNLSVRAKSLTRKSGGKK